MARYIDADALIEEYCGECEADQRGYCDRDICATILWINEAPTVDAVEVVRCRDCKHFTKGMAVGMCKRNPEKPILPMKYNDFCSYGERKEKGDGRT